MYLRGLNFTNIPITTHTYKRSATNITSAFNSRNVTYPCTVCGNACITNKQDCICCTVCDEWTHLKCTDLTPSQFNSYVCDPEDQP